MRPSCLRCRKNNSECVSNVQVGLTRAGDLKKKYDAAQVELQDLRQLFETIRACPDPDLDDLVRDIRWSENPLAALRRVRGSSNAAKRTLPQPRQNAATIALDAHALRQADVKVPARPWTTVAGDGIVSHLISQFLELEHPFLISHIDREIFLGEMIEGDISKAEFCSPLLVNAICALSSVCSTQRCVIIFDH